MSSHPSTPVHRPPLQNTFRPLNSSPLASSPSPGPRCSPFTPSTKQIPERRRLQFKSTTPLTRSSTLPLSSSSTARRIVSSPSARTQSIPSGGSTSTISPFTSRRLTHSPFNHPEDPQKQFLRERIKAKCLERAQKARARAVKKRRYTGYSDRSSDGFEMDDEGGGGNRMDDEDDEEEDDDDIMGDELFRRIMAQTNRKMDHSYRLSYAIEVGSSFDPDIEDVAEWENEVYGGSKHTPSLSPADLEDEELEAYANECAQQAALDEFADIPEEELFQFSDFDDIPEDHQKVVNDMDIS